ncbi:MAG: DUF6680 family protein [Pseudomonadales bacterium]
MWEWLGSVTATSWLTIIAIVIGPIAAVQIEKYLEARREKTRRRMDVFRTLMLSRATTLAPDNVAALNSIDLIFEGTKYKPVRDKWRTLLSHFEDTPSDVNHPNFQQAMIVWTNRTNDLTGQLLQEMGNKLGYDFGDVDIKKAIYYPRAFGDQEAENRLIRAGAVRILTGQQQLQVRTIVDDEQYETGQRIAKAAADILEGSGSLPVTIRSGDVQPAQKE